MNLNELTKLSKDDILTLMGIQTKHSPSDWVTKTLGTFGVGILVGAGIGVLLAPKKGRALRQDIRDRLRQAPEDLEDAVTSIRNDLYGGGEKKNIY
jgi:YtxH-like protein